MHIVTDQRRWRVLWREIFGRWLMHAGMLGVWRDRVKRARVVRSRALPRRSDLREPDIARL